MVRKLGQYRPVNTWQITRKNRKVFRINEAYSTVKKEI